VDRHAIAEERVVAFGLARGYLSPAGVEAARQQVTQLRGTGVPATLLTVASQHLPPAVVTELSAVYRQAVAEVSEMPVGDPHAAGTVMSDPHAAGTVMSDPHAAGTVMSDPHAAGTVISAGGQGPGSAAPTPRGGLPRPGDRVGSYEVVEELARGGMGAVFVARHVELDRRVALKVMLSAGEASPEEQQRFLNEAQAASKLNHPGIVTVHEVGMQAGLAFLAMELVEGESLGDRLRRVGQLDLEEAARLVADVARTLEAAHAAGLLHRDMKPANVLLSADGLAKITDFGIALDTTESDRLTRTGQLLGTPVYMSPEQARGQRNLDRRADVYSLGAILYESITGQRLFEGGSLANILVKVNRVEPVRPSSLRKQISPALEEICLKALRKRRMDRYPSAAALAADLERFLAGKEPEVLRDSLGRSRRSRRAVAIAAGAALVLVGGLVAATRDADPPPVTPTAVVEETPSTVDAPEPTETDKRLWALNPNDSFRLLLEFREQTPVSKAQLEGELALRVVSLNSDGVANIEGRYVYVTAEISVTNAAAGPAIPFDSRDRDAPPHPLDGLRKAMGEPFTLTLDPRTGAASEAQGLDALLKLATQEKVRSNFDHAKKQVLRGRFLRSVFACFHVIDTEAVTWRARKPGLYTVRRRETGPPILTTLIGADGGQVYSVKGRAEFEGNHPVLGELTQERADANPDGTVANFRVEFKPGGVEGE
jgi:serine/threonine protein kinase